MTNWRWLVWRCLCWLARLSFGPALWMLVACGRNPMLHIHCIDVGYGDAILLQDDRGHAILIDGGYGANETDQGRRTILPYLQALGITRLDALICTHSHPDHIGGLVDVARALPVAQVIRPPWGQTNGYTEALDELCAARAIPVNTAARGAVWQWGDLRVTALHPPAGGVDCADGPFDLNANSLALDVQCGRARALLLADITTPVLRELHAAQLLPRAALLKIPHSGQSDAYDEAVMRAIAPQHAVLMVAPNPWGAPASDVVRAYEALCTLWRTDRDGTVVVALRTDGTAHVTPRGK